MPSVFLSHGDVRLEATGLRACRCIHVGSPDPGGGGGEPPQPHESAAGAGGRQAEEG